jgi:hypothetical protein
MSTPDTIVTTGGEERLGYDPPTQAEIAAERDLLRRLRGLGLSLAVDAMVAPHPRQGGFLLGLAQLDPVTPGQHCRIVVRVGSCHTQRTLKVPAAAVAELERLVRACSFLSWESPPDGGTR